MGGFTLIGPLYTFKSLKGMPCRCHGYVGKIPSDIENILVNQERKVLDLCIIPENERKVMMDHHLGNNFNYSVTKHLTKEEEEAKEKKWFDDMVAKRDNIYSEITYSNNKEPSSQLDAMFETMSVDNQTNIETRLEDLIAERSKNYI
jgi:hypothetical protein